VYSQSGPQQHFLDKYTEHGITQLDDLGVLEVSPISTMGSSTELAERFGAVDALHQASTS
jgi:hypothetical protein